MILIIITALILLLVSLAKDLTCTTSAKDLVRSDYDNDMLKELLQRMDKMQNHMEQTERKNNMRFDKMEGQMDRMQRHMEQMQADNKNMSVVMETIQHQYLNATDSPEIETTTLKPVKSFTSCAKVMGKIGKSGVYNIHVENSGIDSFDVYCLNNGVENEALDGKWLIIQRRQDNTTDFYQNWTMYQRGFGDVEGNFWIGLDKLHVLTKSIPQELWVQLEDHKGIRKWAKYGRFAIGDESESYTLKTIGCYEGTAGDSLKRSKGRKWSTYDKDATISICPKQSKAAWWFENCGESSLNGAYGANKEIYEGILWQTFAGWRHLMKYAHMAIRPMMEEELK